MRVFMLGWEFPPFISGGVGTACYGLTKALSVMGVDVLFVMPRPATTPFSARVEYVDPPGASAGGSPGNSGGSLPGGGEAFAQMRMPGLDRVIFRTIDAALADPYATAAQYARDAAAREPASGAAERRGRPPSPLSPLLHTGRRPTPRHGKRRMRRTRRPPLRPPALRARAAVPRTPRTCSPRSSGTPAWRPNSRGARRSTSSTPTSG